MLDWKIAALAVLLLSNIGLGAGIVFLNNDQKSEKASLRQVDFLTLDASRRSIMVKNDSTFCSEPVPDAGNSFAREFATKIAASINSDKAASNIKQVMNTEFTKLFERSQGIQALRDGMYRLCEAFLNKALPPEAYREHIGDLTATLNFIVPLELCAKLNREIVVALAGMPSEDSVNTMNLIEKSRDGTTQPSTDTQSAIKNALAPENGDRRRSDWASAMASSELLTSRFTDKCIKLGADFANNLTVSMQARTIARGGNQTLVSAQAASPAIIAVPEVNKPDFVDPYKATPF